MARTPAARTARTDLDVPALLALIDADRHRVDTEAPHQVYVVGADPRGHPVLSFETLDLGGTEVHVSDPLPGDLVLILWGWDAPAGTKALIAATEVTGREVSTGNAVEGDALSAVLADGSGWTRLSVPGQPVQLLPEVGGRIGKLLRRCIGEEVPWEDDQVSVAEYAGGWIALQVAVELDRVRTALPSQAATLTEGIAERHTLQYAAVLAWQFSDHGRAGPTPEQAQQVHRVADGSEPVLMLDPTSRRVLLEGLRATFADLDWVQVLQHGDSADIFAGVLPVPAMRNPAWGGNGLLAAYASKGFSSAAHVLELMPSRDASPVREALVSIGLPLT
jgi:hypothetical protein